MMKTRSFEASEFKKANDLVIFLTARNIKHRVCTCYVYDFWGDAVQVCFVEYEEKAQMYVEAWEAFMNVQYID